MVALGMLSGAVLGFTIGIMAGAALCNNDRDNMIKTGFFIQHERLYKITPAETPK